MYVAPMTYENWNVYAKWFQEKGLAIPTPPKQAIMVNDEHGLAAGVCIYLTDGPWMFLEHMQLRPGLSPGEIMRAMKLGLAAAKGLGCILGKHPVVLAQREGVEKMLGKVGYVQHEYSVWYAPLPIPPSQSPLEEEEPEPGDVELCMGCGETFLGTKGDDYCKKCELTKEDIDE